MFPSIDIFGRQIPTYGLMAAAGIVCGLLFVFFAARRRKLDAENAVFMYTFGFIGAGVGAKILYIIVSMGQLISDLQTYGFLKTLAAYTHGGMVFYGGLLGSIVAAFITAHALREDIKKFYPALVPGIAILAGFGRIGCYLAGCCYGAHTDSHLFVVYPEGCDAPAGVHLVPVQLYEAIFEGLAVIALVIIANTIPKLVPHLLTLYCASYAVFRFVLEFWRADDVRGIWGPFSTSQWISIAILVYLLIKYLRELRLKMLK